MEAPVVYSKGVSAVLSGVGGGGGMQNVSEHDRDRATTHAEATSQTIVSSQPDCSDSLY
jgi:hypothetical protein